MLPQVRKSSAAEGGSANDVIWGGVDQWSEAGARKQIVDCVFNGNCAALPEGDKITAGQKASAKALYQKLGVTASSVNSAKFSWLLGTSAVSPGNVPTKALAPYLNYRSFGRSNNAGYTAFPVSAAGVTYTFYHKPFVDILSVDGSAADARVPVLEGTSNGIKWIIDLKCGNIIIEKIPPATPSINFEKTVVSVTRGTRTFTQAEVNAAGFKLALNDQIKYNLHGKNGSVAYPAGLRLADAIPVGTAFVRQGGDGWAGGVTVTSVNPKPVVDGKTYVAWDFSAIPANQQGDTDFTVKVTSVAAQICNFGIWSDGADKPLRGATNNVCLGVGKPVLTIKKQIQNGPASVKIGDQLTYKIVMENTGTVAAPNAVALDILKKNASGAVKSEEFVSLGTPALTNTATGAAIPVAANGYHAVKDKASQDSYANGNPDAYGYHLASMPAGSTLTFTITTKAIVLPEACNFAIANFEGSGNAIAVAIASPPCIKVITEEEPHIVVEKTSPTANRNVARNQVIKYSVKVSNTTKTARSTSFTVKDVADPTGSFKSLKQTGTRSSFDHSVTTTNQANGFTWVIAKMPGNSWIAFDMELTVSDTAADGTRICNNATITTDLPNSTDSETSDSVCNTVSLIKQSKTAKYVNRSDDPQKVAAKAGDEIEYTLTTTNQASTVASAYVVTEDLTDVLLYADVTDAGGATKSGSKLIWAAKDIPAGGSITNTFKVKVKNPVPNNAPAANDTNGYDYNMFNFYGNEVNIKVEKPLIDRIVDVATNLPETGAAQYALVVLFLGLSVYFFVRNKQLTSELAAATVEYQHQASASTMSQAQNLIHPEESDDTTPPEPPVINPTA